MDCNEEASSLSNESSCWFSRNGLTGKENGVGVVELVICIAAMLVLGLATLALVFAFVVACDKV